MVPPTRKKTAPTGDAATASRYAATLNGVRNAARCPSTCPNGTTRPTPFCERGRISTFASGPPRSGTSMNPRLRSTMIPITAPPNAAARTEAAGKPASSMGSRVAPTASNTPGASANTQNSARKIDWRRRCLGVGQTNGAGSRGLSWRLVTSSTRSCRRPPV